MPIVIFLFLLSGRLKSQNAVVCDSAAMAAEGTFEIVLKANTSETKATEKLALSHEILCLIEQSRKEDGNVVLGFHTYDIIVFPKKKP